MRHLDLQSHPPLVSSHAPVFVQQRPSHGFCTAARGLLNRARSRIRAQAPPKPYKIALTARRRRSSDPSSRLRSSSKILPSARTAPHCPSRGRAGFLLEGEKGKKADRHKSGVDNFSAASSSTPRTARDGTHSRALRTIRHRRHGPPAGGDLEACVDRLRDRYPGLQLELLAPERARSRTWSRRTARTSSTARSTCGSSAATCARCSRSPSTCTALDAWVTGLRRDQWASRTNIRKVEIDHDHGAIVKLNPLAEWTRRRSGTTCASATFPYHPLYDRGYTSIGCAPCTRADRARRGDPAPAAGGGSRTRPRSAASTAPSRPAASSTSCTRSSATSTTEMTDAVSASAARPPRSHSPRRRPCSRWCRTSERRGRLAELVAAIAEGEVAGRDADALAELLELGPADRPRPRASTGRRASRRRCRSSAASRSARELTASTRAS